MGNAAIKANFFSLSFFLFFRHKRCQVEEGYFPWLVLWGYILTCGACGHEVRKVGQPSFQIELPQIVLTVLKKEEIKQTVRPSAVMFNHNVKVHPAELTNN